MGYDVRQKSAGTVDPFRQQTAFLNGLSMPLILDVGANVGSISEKYRCIFPGATIHAFEPFSESFKELEYKFRNDKKLFPWQMALGDKSTTTALRVNASSTTNSLLDTEDGASSFWGTCLMGTSTKVEVNVSTIDEFCNEHNIQWVDVLKIDTQGTELDVLTGAAKLLSKGQIRLIYTEMIMVPSYKGQAKPHELIDFLDGLGYGLFGLYNLWSGKDGRLLQADAIFIRPENLAASSAVSLIPDGVHGHR